MNLKEITSNLNGETSEEEFNNFKARINLNPQLAIEVERYLLAKSAIIQIVEEEKDNKYLKSLYWAAASAMLIFTSSTVLYCMSLSNHENPGVQMGIKSIKKTENASKLIKK